MVSMRTEDWGQAMLTQDVTHTNKMGIILEKKNFTLGRISIFIMEI